MRFSPTSGLGTGVEDRQPRKVREIAETLDPVELRGAAHKIAWARMNGSIDAANPFVVADLYRRTPGDGTNRLRATGNTSPRGRTASAIEA